MATKIYGNMSLLRVRGHSEGGRLAEPYLPRISACLLVHITVALRVSRSKLEFHCVSLADVHSNLVSETL